jgi:uncharacterized glyoxalase superfamily protein PhnB
MQGVLIASPRRFPRAIGSVLITRKARGTRGILSPITSGYFIGPSSAATSQPWYIPDFAYNLVNQASPDQVYEANQAANAGIIQAETNPITGQIVPAAQAYANNTAGAAGAAEQQSMTQSTGSSVADTFDNLLSNLTGAGTQITTPTTTFPWGLVLGLAALGVGGWALYKFI